MALVKVGGVALCIGPLEADLVVLLQPASDAGEAK